MADTNLHHNLFINWKPEYNLGIPIIDEQHRGIVTIINSLHYGIQNNYIDEMFNAIIDTIYDYTKIHFQLEEDFLRKSNYPNIEYHHSLHDELYGKLKILGKKNVFAKDSHQFMGFLKKWWIDHICHEDQLFKEYITEKISN